MELCLKIETFHQIRLQKQKTRNSWEIQHLRNDLASTEPGGSVGGKRAGQQEPQETLEEVEVIDAGGHEDGDESDDALGAGGAAVGGEERR